jgi:hypothetical protein
VAGWAEATEGRLAELADLAAEADRLASLFDLAGYLGAIQAYAQAVEAAAIDQQTQPVPAVAVEANDQAMAAYATMRDAASLFIRYYTMEMTRGGVRAGLHDVRPGHPDGGRRPPRDRPPDRHVRKPLEEVRGWAS